MSLLGHVLSLCRRALLHYPSLQHLPRALHSHTLISTLAALPTICLPKGFGVLQDRALAVAVAVAIQKLLTFERVLWKHLTGMQLL